MTYLVNMAKRRFYFCPTTLWDARKGLKFVINSISNNGYAKNKSRHKQMVHMEFLHIVILFIKDYAHNCVVGYRR